MNKLMKIVYRIIKNYLRTSERNLKQPVLEKMKKHVLYTSV